MNILFRFQEKDILVSIKDNERKKIDKKSLEQARLTNYRIDALSSTNLTKNAARRKQTPPPTTANIA